jgi:integrase
VATIRERSPGALGEDEVRRVLGAAEELADSLQVEPAAPIALRLAAITGARRSELAALRWADLDSDRLSIDSSVAIIRYPHISTFRDDTSHWLPIARLHGCRDPLRDRALTGEGTSRGTCAGDRAVPAPRNYPPG